MCLALHSPLLQKYWLASLASLAAQGVAARAPRAARLLLPRARARPCSAPGRDVAGPTTPQRKRLQRHPRAPGHDPEQKTRAGAAGRRRGLGTSAVLSPEVHSVRLSLSSWRISVDFLYSDASSCAPARQPLARERGGWMRAVCVCVRARVCGVGTRLLEIGGRVLESLLARGARRLGVLLDLVEENLRPKRCRRQPPAAQRSRRGAARARGGLAWGGRGWRTDWSRARPRRRAEVVEREAADSWACLRPDVSN